MEVVVEGGAEGENSPEGNENVEPQTKTVTFTRHTYTVQYAGDAYFADHVFHLTDEQKKLAQDYAENLTTFLGMPLPELPWQSTYLMRFSLTVLLSNGLPPSMA